MAENMASTDGAKGAQDTWTIDELAQAMLDDPDWDVPPEDREWLVMGLNWTMLDI